MDKGMGRPAYYRITALLLSLALCLSLSCQSSGKFSIRAESGVLLTRVVSKELKLNQAVGKSWDLPADLESFGLSLSAFDTDRAMSHIQYLSGKIGPRPEGSGKEKAAAEYVEKQFLKMGYRTKKQTFKLPNGRTSQNIIASKEGRGKPVRVVIGAHYDAKGRAPGANDNGSGVAVILEVARAVKDKWLASSVDFVAFGAEEMIDKNPDHHHYGSRYYVNQLSSSSSVVGMISIDMVGVGSSFKAGSSKAASRPMVKLVITEGSRLGYSIGYYSIGERSDHEAFENKGIPSAWIGWRVDPNYHTVRDTYDKIRPNNIETTGQTILRWLINLRGTRLEKLETLRKTYEKS